LVGSTLLNGGVATSALRMRTTNHVLESQDGFIHIAASGWISVNTEEKKNKHYIQKVKNQ